MKEFLPQFPLQLVVFPPEKINLHVFEPRYKQLIQECRDEGVEFGIPPHLNGKLMPVGTRMRLFKIAKAYPDGKMDITVEAIGRFKIARFQKKWEGKLYPGADIDPLPLSGTIDQGKNEQIVKLVEKLYKALNIKKIIPPSDDKFLLTRIVHHIGLNIDQEYQLLTIDDINDRQTFVIDHLEKLIPIVVEMEELRKKVQMNGHFRNIIPPKI